MSGQHTPGPWRWEVNLKSKQVELCGGARPQFDLSILRFVRWGMGGAAPMFINERGIMQRAEKLSAVVPGREHHAHWFQTIDHPDARLIAAAPELLDALEDFVGEYVQLVLSGDAGFWDPEKEPKVAAARAAIAKARGDA